MLLNIFSQQEFLIIHLEFLSCLFKIENVYQFLISIEKYFILFNL